MADLIEPYTHVCHDMIDMDVSNLYVKSNYTKDLGMRVMLNLNKVEITLEEVVSNCLEKKYRALRHNIELRK